VIADTVQAAASRRGAASAGGCGVPGAGGARGAFPDWKFAPNIGGHPGTYEIENQAVDGVGHKVSEHRVC